jgi:hypothetical protein
MVKKRMAMRMVTIFVALIVCGMFFPDLARGADLGSDQGLDVSFGDVLIGEEETIPLTITNESETTFTLILLLNMDAACEFTYTGPNVVSGFAPGNTLDVQVAFKPSGVGTCNAVLQVQYFGSGGVVEINFTGSGIEEVSEPFGPVIIGNSTTGVENRTIDEQTNSTLQDVIDDCNNNKDEFKNHGGWVRCIRSKTRDLMEEGYITRWERGKLVSAAAREQMQSLIEKWKERRNRLKRSKGHQKYWWVCSGE